MKESFTDLICCPACGKSLSVVAHSHQTNEIWEGELACPENHTYPIHKGMPNLFIDDEAWQPKAVEAEGWATYHQELGIYDVVADPVDFKIPYHDEEPWASVAKSFDIALAELKLTGAETVLDLGAGRGWAAKEFAKLGCRVVALDIVPDENVGLGRAHAIMHHHQTYFERLIADGENLPFFENSFDLVFCSAALHHSSHLALLLTNVQKVLKKGGRLCAIHEPCLSVAESEEKVLARDAQHEMALGINETRPDLLGYARALERAGLEITKVYPMPAFHMDDRTLTRWGKGMGAMFPPISIRNPKNTIRLLRHYAGPRWAALKNGKYGQVQALVGKNAGRTRTTATILCWLGGEMFLIATKT
jgi:SAM-dependent methyltransferase